MVDSLYEHMHEIEKCFIKIEDQDAPLEMSHFSMYNKCIKDIQICISIITK